MSLCQMSSSSQISHTGRIVGITPELTTVEIVSESACSSCHAKGLCGASESKTKTVTVATRPWDSFSVGDEVKVTLKASMGHKAVWIAYAAPLAVLVAVLLGSTYAGAGELAAGLLSIGAVAVYYFVIWLLRGRLQNEYIFNIISNND